VAPRNHALSKTKRVEGADGKLSGVIRINRWARCRLPGGRTMALASISDAWARNTKSLCYREQRAAYSWERFSD
jgi:hypothetical protein